MRTPPRVSREDVDQAITRIGKRHRRLDDEGWGQVDQENPSDVLRYVMQYSRWARRFVGNDPRRSTAQADLQDAQLLQLWHEWQVRREGHDLLAVMLDLGLPRTQIGSRLGITTAKGVQDLFDRGEALFSDFKRPDAALARGARRAERELLLPDNRYQAWFADEKNRAALASVVAKLLAYYELADEDAAEDLLGLRRDWLDDTWSFGSIEVLGWAVDALRVSDQVLQQAPEHGVFRAIKAADAVRNAFAEATAQAATVAVHQDG